MLQNMEKAWQGISYKGFEYFHSVQIGTSCEVHLSNILVTSLLLWSYTFIFWNNTVVENSIDYIPWGGKKLDTTGADFHSQGLLNTRKQISNWILAMWYLKPSQFSKTEVISMKAWIYFSYAEIIHFFFIFNWLLWFYEDCIPRLNKLYTKVADI